MNGFIYFSQARGIYTFPSACRGKKDGWSLELKLAYYKLLSETIGLCVLISGQQLTKCDLRALIIAGELTQQREAC